MGDHAQKMDRTCVVRIGITDQPVEALSIGQTTGAMMSNRSCERLFGTAPGIHGDAGLASVARPIASKTHVYLTGAAVDPHRLIAGQCARRPVHCVTCNVQGGMHDEPAAAIWRPVNNRCLLLNDIGAVMMPS